MTRRLSQRILRRCQAFQRGEDGNIAIETLIIAPVLFWAFMATFTIYDAYRQHSINQKASYTIGDLVSRQVDALDQSFLTGTQSLFEDLARTQGRAAIRITSVWYDETNDRYQRAWSHAIGNQPAADDLDVAGWRDRLPIMPNFEFITVVETWSLYEAPFTIGIADHEIHNFIFTRPRYAPNITWQGG